jgi:hypothetical protein
MKTASMIGFWVMIGLGVAAFLWADNWWQTLLLIVAALVVAWWSLGLYSRAAENAARRVVQGSSTPDDERLLGELGDRARHEAYRSAHERDSEH